MLVTGCSSGIGQTIAFGLHREGYHVIASCRNPGDCEYLESNGIDTLTLDLDSSDSIQKAVQNCLMITDGRLYGLVNNGAYGQPGAVEDLNRETLRKQFETNVFGTQELTNLVLPTMRKANSGRIVQISSVLGFVCLKYRGAYNSSKYALEGLTDTMRLELTDSGIRISLVEPGPIDSRFRENAYQKYLDNIDRDKSDHNERYKAVEQRLLSDQPVDFMLPPEAVLKVVKHALESPNPKIRYRVTTPTKIFAVLKRILPDFVMDKVLTMNR